MRLYPAIDMKDGKCVRLRQGLFDEKTVYAEEPYRVAMEFEAAGAKFLHLVDLDGALLGAGANDAALRQIIEHVSIPVEIGGGIRTVQDIERKLSMGVARVILGTKAVESPEFVKRAVEQFGTEKIVVGIDAKDGMVAIKGWETVSNAEAVDLALHMKELGVKTIIYTDIAKDGMLCGPNVGQTARLVETTGLNIVASGGVSCMEDLEQLESIGVEGAILGKAIYEKKVDLKGAVARFC
ncbi:MAG: 1-(5-phosphoribosyl)-5-[(5-phosphoribosylamino)methylideneamino]imidazole-4-carboxamide isomerase [Lachnospiraceae bacterium]|nr:1-(5-phosphoribosyl)-5-[(5-phosphoribosylamino)methylideneamino]imidazole-4-carboxamide isomerase [Lachnospiraceae bacterium]